MITDTFAKVARLAQRHSLAPFSFRFVRWCFSSVYTMRCLTFPFTFSAHDASVRSDSNWIKRRKEKKGRERDDEKMPHLLVGCYRASKESLTMILSLCFFPHRLCKTIVDKRTKYDVCVSPSHGHSYDELKCANYTIVYVYMCKFHFFVFSPFVGFIQWRII